MKSSLRSLIASAALVPALFLVTGCETTSNEAKYVDSKGKDTVVSLDQINIQDWNQAAEQMVASLITSGVLERAPTQPSIMAISRIVNNTQTQIDTDSLTKKIRVALNQSGDCRVSENLPTQLLDPVGCINGPSGFDLADNLVQHVTWSDRSDGHLANEGDHVLFKPG